MGMYLKQQQANSRLHSRLTHQLDKHLNQPKNTPHSAAAELTAEKPVVSFRGALFIVLTSGGCVAILLAMVERQNPTIIAGSIQARTLAILGLASIILGCLTLLVRHHQKSSHHHA